VSAGSADGARSALDTPLSIGAVTGAGAAGGAGWLTGSGAGGAADSRALSGSTSVVSLKVFLP
jgi:hypothetical protein